MNKIRKIYDFFIREGYIIKVWGFKGLGLEIISLGCVGLKDSAGILESFIFELNFYCKKEGKDKGNFKLY